MSASTVEIHMVWGDKELSSRIHKPWCNRSGDTSAACCKVEGKAEASKEDRGWCQCNVEMIPEATQWSSLGTCCSAIMRDYQAAPATLCLKTAQYCINLKRKHACQTVEQN